MILSVSTIPQREDGYAIHVLHQGPLQPCNEWRSLRLQRSLDLRIIAGMLLQLQK